MKRLLILPVLLALLVPATAEAKTFMPCDFPSVPTTKALFKPHRCTKLKPGDSFSQGFNFGGLHWSHWDKRSAYFRGFSKGFHLPSQHLRIRGRAYRPREDGCYGNSRKLFTRISIRSRYGKSVIRLTPCARYPK
ncbi:MAG: hypothetical protein JJE13_07665 [Thermoleophilia bacterium]|nr:hypothetical protein [Thermoleophilia bacterium]